MRNNIDYIMAFSVVGGVVYIKLLKVLISDSILLVYHKKFAGAFWCETILTTLWHFLLLAVKWM